MVSPLNVAETVLTSNVNVRAVPAGTSKVAEFISADSVSVIVAMSAPVTTSTIEVTGAAGCFIEIEKTAAASPVDPEKPKKHPEKVHAERKRAIKLRIRGLICIIV